MADGACLCWSVDAETLFKQRLTDAREENPGDDPGASGARRHKPPSPGDGLCGISAPGEPIGIRKRQVEQPMSPGREEKPKTEDLVAVAHELNRYLFDGNGNGFAVALADHIRDRKIVLSKEALDFLVDAIRSVRCP